MQKIAILTLMAGILAVTPIMFGSNAKIVMAEGKVVHSSFSRDFCSISGLTCLRNSPNSEYITADAHLKISWSMTQVDSSRFICHEEVTGYLLDTSTGQTVGTVNGFQTSTHNIGELSGAITVYTVSFSNMPGIRKFHNTAANTCYSRCNWSSTRYCPKHLIRG